MQHLIDIKFPYETWVWAAETPEELVLSRESCKYLHVSMGEQFKAEVSQNKTFQR